MVEAVAKAAMSLGYEDGRRFKSSEWEGVNRIC
jgi:hypothetical protein